MTDFFLQKTTFCVRKMRIYACITDPNFSGNTTLRTVASVFPPLSIISLDFDTIT